MQLASGRSPICGVAALALIASLSCTKTNPAYCDDLTPCASGAPCANNVCAGSCESSEDCSAELPICGENRFCSTCEESEQCAAANPDAPVCAGGECVGCAADSECPGSAPDCDEGTGLCAGCEGSDLCGARDPAAPICDTGACRACATHGAGECPTQVCNTLEGSCVPEADIIYVDRAGADVPECGTLAMPCQTVAASQAKLTAQRAWISLAPGVYAETFAFSGITAQLVGPRTASLDTQGANGLLVTAGANLVIEGISFRDGSSRGVTCNNGSSVAIRDVLVQGHSTGGVVADNCTISVERSDIRGNPGGGVDVGTSTFTLRNNLIVRNGTMTSAFGGVRIENPVEPSIIEHNTIAGNDSIGVDNLSCTGAVALVARSNIIVNGVDTQVAGDCSHIYSNVPGVTGTGNIDVDPMFMAADDYHLQLESPCIDGADPDSAVRTDIDGDDRPQGDRADMGVDEAR